MFYVDFRADANLMMGGDRTPCVCVYSVLYSVLYRCLTVSTGVVDANLMMVGDRNPCV